MRRRGNTEFHDWLHPGAPALSQRQRKLLAAIDDLLFEAWGLGANIVLLWSRHEDAYFFLAVPHSTILDPLDAGDAGSDAVDAGDFFDGVFAGERLVTFFEFERYRGRLGKAARVIRKVFDGHEHPSPALVNQLLHRYSVSLVRRRAVALLDVVGFSLRTPLEQVAMLNSISYSLNSAYSLLLSQGADINFARTTTGDGFYIWHRNQSIEGNILLYKLVMLILADNAVARSKAQRFPVPQIRVAFHVGQHYEFSQVDGLHPTTFGYIVGQVTIDLARMVGHALPGQILIGDFEVEMLGEGDDEVIQVNSLDFVERTARSLDGLRGMLVAGDEIASISCYLTGEPLSAGRYAINRYELLDKHGLSHAVYNAKLNIHRQRAEPIFLGIRHQELPPWPQLR